VTTDYCNVMCITIAEWRNSPKVSHRGDYVPATTAMRGETGREPAVRLMTTDYDVGMARSVAETARRSPSFLLSRLTTIVISPSSGETGKMSRWNDLGAVSVIHVNYRQCVTFCDPSDPSVN